MVESVCVSHAWCMYVPYLSPTNTLHCTDYHPCLVPRAFYTIPILHILQFEEFFHLLVSFLFLVHSVQHSLIDDYASILTSVNITIRMRLVANYAGEDYNIHVNYNIIHNS